MIPKFRAWDKKFKEMVQVDAIVFEEQAIIVTYKNGDFTKKDIKYCELMQSTGLRDKNGKEIFERDILVYNGKKVIVKWHGSYACFIYEFVDELKNRTAEWQPLYLFYFKFEIIGNIYENPEMLEVTE